MSEPDHRHANAEIHNIQRTVAAITSNYVLAELAALFSDLVAHSWQLMARYLDIDFSLVDCSSVVLMKDRGIFVALTTDRHFEQAGFVRLLK